MPSQVIPRRRSFFCTRPHVDGCTLCTYRPDAHRRLWGETRMKQAWRCSARRSHRATSATFDDSGGRPMALTQTKTTGSEKDHPTVPAREGGLTAQEEVRLSRRWRTMEDRAALARLVNA